MYKKSMSIIILLILIGIIFSTATKANYREKENIDKKLFIIGIGDIEGVNLENKTWQFGRNYRALLDTNLIISNSPGMCGIGYSLLIIDLNSVKILTKESLPRNIYLSDFTGYVRRNYYEFGFGHTLYGCFFSIIGFANDFIK